MKKIPINPALKNLEWLVGTWVMEILNASFLPDPKTTITASVSFEWIEDGAYLVMRQGEKTDGMWAIWTISRDETSADYKVSYFDNRDVSRIYEMSFEDNVWKMWRQAPGFSQRFTANVSKDKKVIKAEWESSSDGKKWKHDFDMKYTR